MLSSEIYKENCGETKLKLVGGTIGLIGAKRFITIGIWEILMFSILLINAVRLVCLKSLKSTTDNFNQNGKYLLTKLISKLEESLKVYLHHIPFDARLVRGQSIGKL